MQVGDLVLTNPDTDYAVLGIVTDIVHADNHQLWYDQRIIKVMYTDTGEELQWAEAGLRLVMTTESNEA